MLTIGKLKIHCSFFFFMILIIALGYVKQFFLLLLATTIHELSHILAAKLSGIKVESFILTPIGEIAYLNGFENAGALSRKIVVAAGPLSNFLCAGVSYLFFRSYGNVFISFAHMNIAIGAFNMLPVYPLDGGKFLFILLGNKIGILNSIVYVRRSAKVGIFILLILGLVQIILYPLNFSLIAIAVFLFSFYEREKSSMLLSYYKCMVEKTVRGNKGIAVKTVAFSNKTAIAEIEKLFTWDYLHVVYITVGGEIAGVVGEKQIFDVKYKHAEYKNELDISGAFNI